MEVSGPDAGRSWTTSVPTTSTTLAVGRDRYTTMLNEEGEIIDDVVVMRMDEDQYWVSTLYAHSRPTTGSTSTLTTSTSTTEVTEDWHMFAVQGPKSKEVLNKICRNGVMT